MKYIMNRTKVIKKLKPYPLIAKSLGHSLNFQFPNQQIAIKNTNNSSLKTI